MKIAPSIQDPIDNSVVQWDSPDHKDHKMFKENGFRNFKGRVKIDNVIFKYIVRVGKANFGEVFYDINLEVDQYLPHDKNASGINKRSTSTDNISQPDPKVNECFSVAEIRNTKKRIQRFQF